MDRRALLPRAAGDEKFDDGWLRTGDIAAVDEQGFVQITDRAKDVIKSGGEWISSVELENELMAHPDVRRGGGDRQAGRALGGAAAVLRGAARGGRRPTPRSCVEHLRGRVAKWWLPDEFAFVDEIPKTSVGKFDKKVLRGQARRGQPGGARTAVPERAWRFPEGTRLGVASATTGIADRPCALGRQATACERRTRDDALPR